MAEPFISRQDVVMRLDGTLCAYKGQPVKVYARNGDMVQDINDVAFMKLSTGRKAKINVGHKDFCYRSMRLGFFQEENRAVWLVRVPQRQQKCGIPPRTIKFRSIDSLVLRYHSDNYFASLEMNQCLTGEHRGLQGALDTLERFDNYESVVVSREFALQRFRANVSTLAFRGRSVGTIDHKTKQVTVFNGPDLSYIINIINNQPELGMKV